MKLISSRGTRVLEHKPRMKRLALPDLKNFSKTQTTVFTVIFTTLTTLVLFIPVDPAGAAELPEPAPAEALTTPEPVLPAMPEVEPVEIMTDTERLAVGIYTVIHGHHVSELTAQMVGEVILNRVDSHLFPNTLDEVLKQPYQFGELANGYSWSAIKDSGNPDVALAYGAAKKAMEGSTMLPIDTLYVSDTEQGVMAAMMDGLYFGR